MRVRLFHNPRAGAAKGDVDIATLVAALRDAGVEAESVELHEATLGPLVAAAAGDGFDAVIAAGGDGTVSAVASALASAGEGAVPLGVLPVGTLNHFAKDLNLPLRLPDAASVVA